MVAPWHAAGGSANGLHKTARSLLGVRANGELLMVTMSGSSGDYDDFF